VLQGRLDLGTECVEVAPDMVGHLGDPLPSRGEFLGAPVGPPQQALDLELVFEGSDVDIGDHPRDRDVVRDDVLEIVGAVVLENRENADHDAEQRKQHAGEGEELGANAHGRVRSRLTRECAAAWLTDSRCGCQASG
jgi:hypothetical protein